MKKGSSKDVEVVRVIRDEFGKAIWARIQCSERFFRVNLFLKKVYHDVVFMPDGKKWVYVHHKILNDYIPPNRYRKMAKKAAAIFYEKQLDV